MPSSVNFLLEKAGGECYLKSLAEAVSTAAGVRYHSEIVKEQATKRKLVELAQGVIDRAGESSSAELAEQLRKDLVALEIRDQFNQRTGVDLENVYTAERCLEEYQSYISNLKKNRFVTGIHEIDKQIRGVAGGEVLTIIARAGTFKTALLQNLLRGYIQNSAWGAVFMSLEMPVASVTERYHEIITGFFLYSSMTTMKASTTAGSNRVPVPPLMISTTFSRLTPAWYGRSEITASY
jgi:replicative DNA helicase